MVTCGRLFGRLLLGGNVTTAAQVSGLRGLSFDAPAEHAQVRPHFRPLSTANGPEIQEHGWRMGGFSERVKSP